ncbi:NAD(P)-binding protein [Xylariaceae sp. AK1471]|nr:NAD(P)-binding protein [Xylariaceae sp. AK1471]
MSTYVISGVSKGLGFEFLRQLSDNPKNIVIGLARDTKTTQHKVSEELSGRSNIHIVHGDLLDYESLKKAAAETAAITGGSLDYLIANAGYMAHWDAYHPLGTLAQDPTRVQKEMRTLYETNITGNIYLISQFMPLILKGDKKKVIAITSGQGDRDVVNQLELELNSLYAVVKAGLNMLVAKYSAQYKQDGVLFLAVCPGAVDNGHYDDLKPEQIEAVKGMMGKFVKYAPHFRGPVPPAGAIADVIKVWEEASIEKGNAGDSLSHWGNKRWL